MEVVCIGSGNAWVKDNSACYLIDGKILLDMPNGSLKAMARLDLPRKNVHDVLITHMHGDHFFDVPFYLYEKIKMEKSYANIYTYGGGASKINQLTQLAFPDTNKEILSNKNVRYITGDKFEILGYTVKRVKVEHGNLSPCFGYIFKRGDLSFGFTGDAAYTNAVDEIAKECQFLVCDCNFMVGNYSHMGVDNIKTLASKFPNVKIYTSHMGATVRDMFTDRPTNVSTLKDGQIIFQDEVFRA